MKSMRQTVTGVLSPDGVAIQIWQGVESLPEPCPQDDAVLPGHHLAAAGEDPPALLILAQPLPAGPRMREPALCLQPPPAWRWSMSAACSHISQPYCNLAWAVSEAEIQVCRSQDYVSIMG